MAKSSVHTSDIRQFKGCRRAWNYSSPLRGNWQPKRRPLYFTRGSAWHKALEHFYQYKALGTTMSGEELADVFKHDFISRVRTQHNQGGGFTAEEVQRELATGMAVLPMYPEWAEEHDNFEVVAIEEKGRVPLIDGANFSYRADQVIKRKGKYWIHDFKTAISLPDDPSFLDFDEQITGYLKACELVYKVRFVGAIFTYLLVKEPTEPAILKRGGLSKDKRIITTPQLYFDKLLEIGEDPRDYIEVLQRLDLIEWFRRFEIVKRDSEKEALWEMHKNIAEIMTAPDAFIYPAPEKIRCQLCSYKGPCMAENLGKDPKRILETEFVQGKDRS